MTPDRIVCPIRTARVGRTVYCDLKYCLNNTNAPACEQARRGTEGKPTLIPGSLKDIASPKGPLYKAIIPTLRGRRPKS